LVANKAAPEDRKLAADRDAAGKPPRSGMEKLRLRPAKQARGGPTTLVFAQNYTI